RDWDLKSELATAYQRIADVQGNVMGANLGNTKAALESYGKALVLLDAVLGHDPANRGVQLARVTIMRHIGSVHLYTQETGRALASFREAQAVGEGLLAQDPGDARIAGELAQVYTACGDALWITGAFAASIEEHSKAVTLLQK